MNWVLIEDEIPLNEAKEQIRDIEVRLLILSLMDYN
jgi:hypothetical protein